MHSARRPAHAAEPFLTRPLVCDALGITCRPEDGACDDIEQAVIGRAFLKFPHEDRRAYASASSLIVSACLGLNLDSTELETARRVLGYYRGCVDQYPISLEGDPRDPDEFLEDRAAFVADMIDLAIDMACSGRTVGREFSDEKVSESRANLAKRVCSDSSEDSVFCLEEVERQNLAAANPRITAESRWPEFFVRLGKRKILGRCPLDAGDRDDDDIRIPGLSVIQARRHNDYRAILIAATRVPSLSI